MSKIDDSVYLCDILNSAKEIKDFVEASYLPISIQIENVFLR